MPVWITVNYRGWFAALAAKHGKIRRDVRQQVMTYANRAVVKHWHDVFIPPHLERSASWRYHYQQRKRAYKAIKRKLAQGARLRLDGAVHREDIKKGGLVDIVRSGQTEKKAEGATLVHATAFRAIARVKVPSYILRRRLGAPNMKKELQRLTRAERKALVVVWKRNAVQRFHRYARSIPPVKKTFK